MDPFEDEQGSGGGGFDISQLLRMFWRRKWLFFVPFILCLTMAGVAIKVQDPIYFSGTLIRVIHETATASVLGRDGVSRYGRRNPDDEAMYNIETIVTGPNFLERVAQDFMNLYPEIALRHSSVHEGSGGGMLPDEHIRSRLVFLLQRGIRVSHVARHLFEIGIRDTDPERAYLLIQVLLERFLEEERASRLLPNMSMIEFLESRRDECQQDCDDAELELANFLRSRLTESLAGNPISESNLTQAENALSRLRAQYYDADTTELRNQEQKALNVLGELPDLDRFTQDSDIAAISRELASLEFDQMLSLNFENQGSTLGGLRLRLNAAIEQKVVRDFAQVARMDRNDISQYIYHSTYRAVRQNVMNRMATNIQEFREFMNRQPEQSATLSHLQQEVEQTRETLQSIENDLTRENMKIEANRSELGYRMEVHQDPYLPGAPIEPNMVKLAFMGFVLALAIGGGLVILAHFLDRSFSSVTAIEAATGLKVIGTLPVIESDFFRKQRQRRFWIWLVLIVGILLVAAVSLLFVYPRLG